MHIYINCGYVGIQSAQVRYDLSNNITPNYFQQGFLFSGEASHQVATV